MALCYYCLEVYCIPSAYRILAGLKVSIINFEICNAKLLQKIHPRELALGTEIPRVVNRVVDSFIFNSLLSW